MESINTIGGALGLSIVAMSIVFLILGGLALMMVFIKHIAKALERAPLSAPASAPPKPKSKPKASPKPAVEVSTKAADLEKDIAVIAAALAAFLGRKAVKIWRISGPVRTSWREAARIESIIGGYESNE